MAENAATEDNQHYWEAAKTRWFYDRNETVKSLESYASQLPRVNAVLDGLTVCFYHLDNVSQYEHEITDYIKNHPPIMGIPTTGIFYVNQIAIEYQSFILAERHLFDYLSWTIGLKLNLTKEDSRYWDWKELDRKLKKQNKFPELSTLIEKFFLSNLHIEDSVIRNQIAHYSPLGSPQMELMISGWGSTSLRYMGFSIAKKGKEHQVYPQSDAKDVLNSLFSPSKTIEIQNPIAPLIRDRLHSDIQFIKNIFALLAKQSL
jgi:hypothetical protein